MKYRFALLSLAVFAIMFQHTRSEQWAGDFWEHSAVVRELATNILHPKHPQLLLEAPHAFYSPYAVMVALLSRTLRSDAVTALAIMGLVNLSLLFLGFWLFVSSMVTRYRGATAFYALLLTLFCWGSHPWLYSGFFHIGVLGYVLPYPSTFAAALTLIALGVNRLRIDTQRYIWLAPIFLIAVTVLISHPITFLFLGAGLISQACAEKVSVRSEIVLIGSLLSLTFLLAALWPYFPVLKLLMRDSAVYDASNRVMYHRVVSRTWPSLIGLPLVIASMRTNWRRPLVLMLVMLWGVYVLGAISGKYSYGRVIAYIVLIFHVAIAEQLSVLESRLGNVASGTSGRLKGLNVSAIVMVFALLLSFRPLRTTLERALFEHSPTYKSYLFLSRFTGQYDVVLSDIKSSWIVPTFGGKVVAAEKPLAFVPDQDIRKADLDLFFTGQATLGDRQRIIQKYSAEFLLLRKTKDVSWQDLQQSLVPQGRVLFESESFVLMSLKPKSGEVHRPPPRAMIGLHRNASAERASAQPGNRGYESYHVSA